MNKITEGALFWAQNGVPVFPCGLNKQPLTSNGFFDASCDPVKVREMFDFYDEGECLVGARTGKESGLVVFDFDLYKGDQPKQYLERMAPMMPSTRTHKTVSGGLHIFYNSETDWPNMKPCPGVEIKGEGGYVIVPPSRGYEVMGENKLMDMPDILLKELQIARDVAASSSEDDLKLSIMDATDFHDALRTLAAKRSAAGVPPEAVMTELRTTLEASVAAHPEHERYSRWNKLVKDDAKELSRIVRSGYTKYNPTAKDNAFREAYDEKLDDAAFSLGFSDPNVDAPMEVQLPDPVYDTDENPFAGEGYSADQHYDVTTQVMVNSIMPQSTVSLISAAPKAGKTAFMIGLSVHTALGRDYGKIAIPERHAVLYFALEGAYAIRMRVEAWKRELEADDTLELVQVVETPRNLFNETVRDRLTKQIAAYDAYVRKRYGIKLGVVVFDTLTKAMPAGDQNSASDTAAVFAINAMIHEVTQAHIVYVHHKTKDGSSARGSSNIQADPDTLLGVKKDDLSYLVTVENARLIEEGDVFTYHGKSVHLGENSQGMSVDSFIMLPEDPDIANDIEGIEGAFETVKTLKLFTAFGEGVHPIESIYNEMRNVSLIKKAGRGFIKLNSEAFQKQLKDLLTGGRIAQGFALTLAKDAIGNVTHIEVRRTS